ncbi:MAG: hypothetical protein KTR17_08680 [Cellvibrionaceae bacterium]|nr:hypothetical protein [Cellvibrionaceae bacterium]
MQNKITQANAAQVLAQVERINASQAIGRSQTYKRLLTFLVDCELKNSVEGSGQFTPKEFDIATKIFNRDKDFDANEDASVRVYVSNLRKKLEKYYRESQHQEDFQIKIPRGSYKPELVTNTELDAGTAAHTLPLSVTDSGKATASPRRLQWFWLAVFALLLSLSANLYLYFKTASPSAPSAELEPASSGKRVIRPQQHILWRSLLSADRPLLIVHGDFFVFKETDDETGKTRTIRDRDINNQQDFEAYLREFPAKRDKTFENRSPLIIKSNVVAMGHLIPLVSGSQAVSVKLASQLSPQDLSDYNIIFVGLYKTLGSLSHYFQGSRYRLSDDNNRLIKRDNNKAYYFFGDAKQEHIDYGLLGKFKGPSGNTILIVSGFSDTAVIQIIKNIGDPESLAAIDQQLLDEQPNLSFADSLELLFEVSGYDRTDLAAKIISHNSLDQDAIWVKTKGATAP